MALILLLRCMVCVSLCIGSTTRLTLACLCVRDGIKHSAACCVRCHDVFRRVSPDHVCGVPCTPLNAANCRAGAGCLCNALPPRARVSKDRLAHPPP